MAYKCDLCGKGKMVGKQHRHHAGVAGNRWNRRAPKTLKVFKPNLHNAKVVIAGTAQRLKLCTKCLRIMKDSQKASNSSDISSVAQSTSTA